MSIMDGSIIKAAIKAAGKTQEEAAEIVGLSREHLGRLLKGEVPIVYIDKLKAEGIDIPDVINSDKGNCYMVPLKAFGGFLAGYKDKVYLDSLQKSYFPNIVGECYSFEVDGFSMFRHKLIDGEIYENGYKPGSYVITTPVEDFRHMVKGKDYVFVTVDGIIIKRFERIKDDECIVSCINEEYNPVKPLKLRTIKKVFYVQKRYA